MVLLVDEVKHPLSNEALKLRVCSTSVDAVERIEGSRLNLRIMEEKTVATIDLWIVDCRCYLAVVLYKIYVVPFVINYCTVMKNC